MLRIGAALDIQIEDQGSSESSEWQSRRCHPKQETRKELGITSTMVGIQAPNGQCLMQEQLETET
jgi:hypothetical protein